MAQEQINIKNRKARFEYHIHDTYEAGLKLLGTEIKSIREGRASLAECYCYFKGPALYVKNMHIAEYSHGNTQNHEPLRERKLLLHKRELEKLQQKLEKGGNNTIVPLRLYINGNGLAKLEIALATGKKLYDKRQSIKDKDMKRESERRLKF
ncbi:MAG: SsrA-binding protein SmpB [Owenweeksia sp.]|nr:SsrA-binding protein SmpB [Owenweeksia sp.]